MMRMTLESTGGVSCRVVLGRHELLFDQPREFGGGDIGPSPVEVLASCVGACAHYYAAVALKKRGFATDGLSVEVEAEKLKEPRAHVVVRRLVVHAPTGTPPELVPVMERSVRLCPVVGTLELANEVPLEIAVRT